MNKAEIIKSQLARIGVTVCLKDGEWTSMPFKASLSRLWRKKSSGFEHTLTELGEAGSDYYLFIGPYNHNIRTLSADGILLYDGDEYEFKCKDPVMLNDTVLYYSGVLRKIRRGDYDEA